MGTYVLPGVGIGMSRTQCSFFVMTEQFCILVVVGLHKSLRVVKLHRTIYSQNAHVCVCMCVK